MFAAAYEACRIAEACGRVLREGSRSYGTGTQPDEVGCRRPGPRLHACVVRMQQSLDHCGTWCAGLVRTVPVCCSVVSGLHISSCAALAATVVVARGVP